MPIAKLNKAKHGFHGLRVLVQINGVKHLKYFSFADLSAAEILKQINAAEQLNNELLSKKRESKIKSMSYKDYRTSKIKQGLTGIRLYFGLSKATFVYPFFRANATADGVAAHKTFSISKYGYVEAWKLAVDWYADIKQFTKKERQHLYTQYPSKDICRKVRNHHVRNLGYPISVHKMKEWGMW